MGLTKWILKKGTLGGTVRSYIEQYKKFSNDVTVESSEEIFLKLFMQRASANEIIPFSKAIFHEVNPIRVIVESHKDLGLFIIMMLYYEDPSFRNDVFKSQSLSTIVEIILEEIEDKLGKGFVVFSKEDLVLNASIFLGVW